VPELKQRLESGLYVWFATIREDKRPHLVPLWFAWTDNKFYVCIQGDSVKAKNIRKNPHISLSLEDASNVVICEGLATFLDQPWPEDVQAIFLKKYGWNTKTDVIYDSMVEISPLKWLIW
jgi:general stress protein 26